MNLAGRWGTWTQWLTCTGRRRCTTWGKIRRYGSGNCWNSSSGSLAADRHKLRTFFLIVPSILGPISFALAVYDGFQSTLTTWLSLYICIYLWLPVGDLVRAILSRIQILMLQQDIKQMQDPFHTGCLQSLLHFMIIGIIGYFCVPTVSSWIIQAGGAGAYGQKANGAGKWPETVLRQSAVQSADR